MSHADVDMAVDTAKYQDRDKTRARCQQVQVALAHSANREQRQTREPEQQQGHCGLERERYDVEVPPATIRDLPEQERSMTVLVVPFDAEEIQRHHLETERQRYPGGKTVGEVVQQTPAAGNEVQRLARCHI